MTGPADPTGEKVGGLSTRALRDACGALLGSIRVSLVFRGRLWHLEPVRDGWLPVEGQTVLVTGKRRPILGPIKHISRRRLAIELQGGSLIWACVDTVVGVAFAVDPPPVPPSP